MFPLAFLYSLTDLMPWIFTRYHLSSALRFEYEAQLAYSNRVLHAKHLGPGYLYHWAANQRSVPIPIDRGHETIPCLGESTL
jgi:hypothetical protein